MISRTLARVVVPLKTTTPTRFLLLFSLSQFSTTQNTDTATLVRLKHKYWLTPKEAISLLTSVTHPSSTLPQRLPPL